MKKVLLASVVFVVLAACGKYPEGPGFSLASKKARITNNWSLSSQSTNGQTDDLSNFTWQVNIMEDDTYSSNASFFNVPFINESGSWRFSDDKLNFLTTPNGSANTDSWKIIKLKKDEFKIEWYSGQDTIVSTFIPQN